MGKSSSAFSPAHITGFFTIGSGSSNGAGFTLADGMRTAVKITSGKGNKTKIAVGGKSPRAIVSSEVASAFRKSTGSEASILISHSPAFPIGYGLGMSAAGALSLSLALNKALGAKLPRAECARIGFEAEVKCGTGLSAIFAEEMGGFITRRSFGGEIERVKLRRDERNLPVVCAFLAPIKTASVIRSASWKEKINKAGSRSLENFWADKSLENFISQAREFAFESKLATPRIRKILSENPDSAMAMLGETVFEFAEDAEETARRFKRYASDVRISRISEKGAHLL